MRVPEPAPSAAHDPDVEKRERHDKRVRLAIYVVVTLAYGAIPLLIPFDRLFGYTTDIERTLFYASWAVLILAMTATAMAYTLRYHDVDYDILLRGITALAAAAAWLYFTPFVVLAWIIGFFIIVAMGRVWMDTWSIW